MCLLRAGNCLIAPLHQKRWSQVFPTEEAKHDHLHGYCISKVLLQGTPVLNTKDLAVRPLAAKVPRNFSTVLGSKLPQELSAALGQLRCDLAEGREERGIGCSDSHRIPLVGLVLVSRIVLSE